MNKTKFALTSAACALALICSQSVLAASEPAAPAQAPAAAQEQAAPALPHLRIAGSARPQNEAAPAPQPAPQAAPAPQPGPAPQGAPLPPPPAETAAAPAPAAAPELLRVPEGGMPAPSPDFAAAAPAPQLNEAPAPQGGPQPPAGFFDGPAPAFAPHGWQAYHGYGRHVPACPPRGFEPDFAAGPDFNRGPAGFEQEEQAVPPQPQHRAGVPGSRYHARVIAALSDERFQDLAADIADLEDQYFVEQSVLLGMQQQTDVNLDELREQAQLVVDLRNQVDGKYDELMQQYDQERRARRAAQPAPQQPAPAAEEEARPDVLPGLDRQELRRAMMQRQLQQAEPAPQPAPQPQLPPRHHRWQLGE